MAATGTTTVNTKVSVSDKETFDAIVEKLGLTQAAVLRNFVKAFNSAGGFPYDVNYPMGAEEKASIEELDKQIANGTAKTYADIYEILNEKD